MIAQTAAHKPLAEIDFWFSIGSTYTYLSVMRLAEVAERSAVRFRWRPFDVRAIMVEMNNIPFSTKPVKAAYMWKDIGRRARSYGHPFDAQPPYPLKSLASVNRVALVAANEGWCPDFVVAAYKTWFGKGLDPSLDDVLEPTIATLGKDAERIMELARSNAVRSELEQQTGIARELGVFGAPTFAVGSEIFWGDDRLDDAISWARK
jgi:2-hydroxychromene-2-carboxylate isomerase